ncbi:Shedu anti-phage system protein SduA domain-containing protein [Streptomyces sp. NPDC001743]|uniref:Shedu anti-phage system protein SduA domain-containing protein n=1 Tax=Streptomyces sp. NPDC001743 TaxID=3154397 RepID=UPI003329DB82
MAETDWQKVVVGLRLLYAGPTKRQLILAGALAVSLDPATPSPVAAALLRTHLAEPLRLRDSPLIDEPEYEYLARVAAETTMRIPKLEEIQSRDILNAWLEVVWARRSVSCLERLVPEVGDVVVTATRRQPEEDRYGQVSSIRADGRLNFRGGRGRGARPHIVKRIVKSSDSDHAELVLKAREEVVNHDPYPERVTDGDLARLEPWKVTRHPSLADREALRETLHKAAEERPMQVVLEKHPSLLANVVTGNHGTWVRPQVRFGDQYIPDFLIGSRTSAGLRWHLVELESPAKRLTNPGNGRESPTLRQAINQIQDWREWLKVNLLSARQKLPGITVDARGLIIMGREDLTDSASEIRDRWSTNARIEIRTYDWLVRAAERGDLMVRGLLDNETGDLDGDDW